MRRRLEISRPEPGRRGRHGLDLSLLEHVSKPNDSGEKSLVSLFRRIDLIAHHGDTTFPQ